MREELRKFINYLEALDESIAKYELDNDAARLYRIDQMVDSIADHQLEIIDTLLTWRNAQEQ